MPKPDTKATKLNPDLPAFRASPASPWGDLKDVLDSTDELPTARLIDTAVGLQAAAATINRAKRQVYDRLERRATAHRHREGTKFRAPVPGVGQAYLPESEPTLKVDEQDRLAEWLAEHEHEAFEGYVFTTRELLIGSQAQAVEALANLRGALTDYDLRDEEQMQRLAKAAHALTGQLAVKTTTSVDIDALAEHWPDRTEQGLPVTPSGEVVPYVYVQEAKPGALTVRPDKAYIARLAKRYSQALGIPEETT